MPLFARPIAHRGLHDKTSGIIENSTAAFDAAIAKGFGIECDVQLSADGVAMVIHDSQLQRLAGDNRRVQDLSEAELSALPLLGSAGNQAPQPLAHLLAQVNGQVPLVIELKQQPDAAATRGLARAVADALSGYSGTVALKSFDPALLVALRETPYKGPLGIITYRYDTDEAARLSGGQRFALRHLLHYPRTHFTFISCERTALALPAVRIFRSLGMKVMSWTVREKSQVPAVLSQADQIVFEGFDPDQ